MAGRALEPLSVWLTRGILTPFHLRVTRVGAAGPMRSGRTALIFPHISPAVRYPVAQADRHTCGDFSPYSRRRRRGRSENRPGGSADVAEPGRALRPRRRRPGERMPARSTGAGVDPVRCQAGGGARHALGRRRARPRERRRGTQHLPVCSQGDALAGGCSRARCNLRPARARAACSPRVPRRERRRASGMCRRTRRSTPRWRSTCRGWTSRTPAAIGCLDATWGRPPRARSGDPVATSVARGPTPANRACGKDFPGWLRAPEPGWGGRIRTSAWRNQNPLPYRLATPQQHHEVTCAAPYRLARAPATCRARLQHSGPSA